MWALLSDEAEARLRAQADAGMGARLKPDDWKSGDNLWLVDLVIVDSNERAKMDRRDAG